jgi:hypothetical protein
MAGVGHSPSSLRRPTRTQALLVSWLACAVLLRPAAAQPLVLDAENFKGCVAFQHDGRATITNQRPECINSGCVGCAEPHTYHQADMPACKARANTGDYNVQPRAFALVMDKALYLCEAGATSPGDSASLSVAWRATFDASRCCWQRTASAPPCSRAFSALVSLALDTTGWLLHHSNGWLWVAPHFLSQGVPQDYCWRLPDNATAVRAAAAVAAPPPPPGPMMKFVCNPPVSSCPDVYGESDFVPCKPALGPALRPGYECWAPEASCPTGYTAIGCSCISHGGSLAVACDAPNLNRGSCTCLYVNPTALTFQPGAIELLTMSVATCARADLL